MDVEQRIRELKAELEYLEAQRLAQPTSDYDQYAAGQGTPERFLTDFDLPGSAPYQTMPSRRAPKNPGSPLLQKMPYGKSDRRPGPFIKPM